MANILDYLSWRGDLTLAQSPFNEVDNLILAELSFVNFTGIVPGPGEGEGVLLHTAAEAFFRSHEGGDMGMGVLVPDEIPALLRKMAECPRFREMRVNCFQDHLDVRKAEQFAAEDKKRREEVDVRNNADQMVFQTEKALGEFGDKVSAEEKSEVETKLSALKEALKSGSVDDIKAKQDDLQKAFYAISEKVYQQAAQAQGQQPGAQPGPDAGAQPKDDGAVDADFHEV